MQEQTEFKGFPKVYRFLEQPITITEKIDGTNALVFVSEDGVVRAGSKNRWLTLEDDNAGFAKFVASNSDELLKLGPGYHYGEWWGKKIARGYNMDTKVFSLFNVSRWTPENCPSCCDVVPVLYEGTFTTAANDGYAINIIGPSRAAQKYDKAADMEGVMVYFHNTGCYMKVLPELGHKGKKE